MKCLKILMKRGLRKLIQIYLMIGYSWAMINYIKIKRRKDVIRFIYYNLKLQCL